MTRRMLAIPVAVLLLLAGAAFGYPALNGPTGIVALPTAEIAGAGSLQLAADLYNVDQPGLDNVIPARVLIGVFPNLEAGGSFWFADTDEGDLNTWTLDAKLGSPVGLFGFDLALGAIYASTEDPIGIDVNTTQAYAVLGNNLGIPGGSEVLKASFGANWTRIEIGDFEEDAVRGFATLEFALLDQLRIAAEYQTKSDDLGDVNNLTSLVLRLRPTSNLTLQGGMTNADFTGGFTGLDDHNLFVGARLAWGG